MNLDLYYYYLAVRTTNGKVKNQVGRHGSIYHLIQGFAH